MQWFTIALQVLNALSAILNAHNNGTQVQLDHTVGPVTPKE